MKVRKLPIKLFIAVFLLGLTIVASIYFVFIEKEELPKGSETLSPTNTAQTILFTTASPTLLPATQTPLSTPISPLSQIEFPQQKINYPSNWPVELRYPDEFTLVFTSSGVIPGGDLEGWGAMLRYDGPPVDAADLLSDFFASKGWTILERSELDAGGIYMIVGKNNNKNQGSLFLDPDDNDPTSTKIFVIAFP